ncbi:phosphate transport system regulatory protein PhoU [candidate division TA06 bacterium]|uniref:Phosphate-specific transport system accessory protein PhoU n=1 Tax=candidate division TA06 bacterium TaxID=2250710 RepID=A0A660SKF3_UNCT6|nr:MAG: phosphate transport system regulatory protein PhoU [candidate division TA06 bacterium]
MLKEQIELLKKEVIEYSLFIENIIKNNIEGIEKNNRDILIQIIEKDEPKTNLIEIEIENKCIDLIARYQPKAIDLRMIIMSLKMNNDLERIADHSANIANSSLYIIERPEIKEMKSIKRMSEEVLDMFEDSIKSFIQMNANLASAVYKRDDYIDKLRLTILKSLIGTIRTNPDNVESIFHIERITKNLERIADLTTNLCEDIIFIVEGKIIKHKNL